MVRGRLRPLLLGVSLRIDGFAGVDRCRVSAQIEPSRRCAGTSRAADISGTARVGHVLRVWPGRWTKASRFVYL